MHGNDTGTPQQENSLVIDRTKAAVVTGANGYIASWLVKYLLEEGIDVHATVRNPEDPAKVDHLLRIARNAPGKLTLFRADLLDEGSFDAPMAGCGVVFHTASPFRIRNITNAMKELVEPAIQGTHNVLSSVERNSQVRRVVLTSSIAAVHGDNAEIRKTRHGVFIEQEWNTTSSLFHQPYSYSKAQAERMAWQIAAAQKRWKLVVINPGFALGPSLTECSASGTFDLTKSFLDGSLRFGAPALCFGLIDVRDVALAHMKAGYLPSASGRHILVSESCSMLQIGKILRRRFGGGYPFPRWEVPKALIWLFASLLGVTREFVAKNVGFPVVYSKAYAQLDLQIFFRSIEETLTDHFKNMICN